MTGTRTKNPRGQGDRLRQELLRSAVQLMAEHRSSESVTLRQVAAGAGVSPTAVYRHFADRDDLVRAAVTWCWARFDEALEVPDTGDPVADFLTQGRAYVRFAAEEPGIYRVLFSYRGPLPGLDEHPGRRVFEKLIDRCAALLQRQDDDRDPELVAVQVHTWIHGIADLQQVAATGVRLPTDWMIQDLGVRLGLVPD